MVLTDKYDVVGFNMYVDNDLCVFVVNMDKICSKFLYICLGSHCII